MVTIPSELPPIPAPYRREIQMLAVARACRSQLGPHFEYVESLKPDDAGDPLVLGFRFEGSNRLLAHLYTSSFMRDLLAEVRERHGVSLKFQ
jgi:hypothetical protein